MQAKFKISGKKISDSCKESRRMRGDQRRQGGVNS
jgi:hypothetical protein